MGDMGQMFYYVLHYNKFSDQNDFNRVLMNKWTGYSETDMALGLSS